MRGGRRHTTLVLAVLAAAAAISVVAVSLASAGENPSATSVARKATARFQNLAVAKRAGWNTVVKDAQGIVCIDNQPVGGMGVHYANKKFLGDATLDPRQPEALVYIPNGGRRAKLAALEYIVFADAWTKAGHSDAPSLFGQELLLTPDGNRFGIPAFWSLHLWIWRPNPAGKFQPWNPRVKC
jgi:hypothetical protein